MLQKLKQFSKKEKQKSKQIFLQNFSLSKSVVDSRRHLKKAKAGNVIFLKIKIRSFLFKKAKFTPKIIFFNEKKKKDSMIFRHKELTLKVRILQMAENQKQFVSKKILTQNLLIYINIYSLCQEFIVIRHILGHSNVRPKLSKDVFMQNARPQKMVPCPSKNNYLEQIFHLISNFVSLGLQMRSFKSLPDRTRQPNFI